MKKVSIVIRTKNEERWIAQCIRRISRQTYTCYEIIVVDSGSTDNTVSKAHDEGAHKIVFIDEYLPGKSINKGVEVSDGEYIAILSAHCLPVDEYWLRDLVDQLEQDTNYAGVYGKQLPMEFSSDADKRDLLICFGDDIKVQSRDSFFHNANSIVRKKVLDLIPFDSEATNIEDRLWASNVQKEGYKVVYTPKAGVYHYHGIHQTGSTERLKGVTSMLEEINLVPRPGVLTSNDFQFIAAIPVRGSLESWQRELIARTIALLVKLPYIQAVFVASDNQHTADYVTSLGAKVIGLRPMSLSLPTTSIEEVHSWHLKEIESKTVFKPDAILHCDMSYPFRTKSCIDRLVDEFCRSGKDTALAARMSYDWSWRYRCVGELDRIDEGDIPRPFKDPLIISSHGLGCITHAATVRSGTLVGEDVHFCDIKDQMEFISIRREEEYKQFSDILNPTSDQT